MQKTRNALGKFLLETPIGDLHPPKQALSPQTWSNPLFRSVPELASFMPGHNSESNLYGIMKGTYNPSPETQHAMEEAVRKKLAATPGVANVVIAKMTAVIDSLRNASPAADPQTPQDPRTRAHRKHRIRPERGAVFT